MYVLDEPPSACTSATTTGCWNAQASGSDLGNTVIVVEHDEDAISAADYVVDIGPSAGVHGGEVVRTARCQDPGETHQPRIGRLPFRRQCDRGAGNASSSGPERMLEGDGARGNNLKGVDVRVPVGLYLPA